MTKLVPRSLPAELDDGPRAAAGDDFVDVQTEGGDTPLMLSAWQGHVGCCKLLATCPRKPHADAWAGMQQNLESWNL